MITKKKIRNWETIKNNNGKYNSVMDEINRNFSISKKIKANIPVKELYKIVMIGIHQSFNINSKLVEGAKFSSSLKQNSITTTINYYVDKIIDNSFISLSWSIGNDKYWTEFKFKEREGNSTLVYTESVLREDTISGIQGTIDISFYKRSYKKNFKKWIYIIKKTNDEINKILLNADSFDKKAQQIKSSDEYNNLLTIYNKFKGKKNLDQENLKTFKKTRSKIQQLDKKINKLVYKSKAIRYNVFKLEDKWIEFVDKNYNNMEK